jgi:threonine dehydrogenase-like Zn-dependent dehydrogenase
MRGVVARRGRLVVEELPDPVPGPEDALVALRACGICGSDLHTLAHADALPAVEVAAGVESRFRPERDFYLGHEWVAEVLEVGSAASGSAAPGDRVVSIPYLVRGLDLVPLGFSNDDYAGYCERFLLTGALCRRVPNGLEDRRAALTEPMAVGLHAVNQARLERGDVAAVIGCGPIGLAVIAWLRRRDVAPIVATDYSARRREVAAALGADVVLDPAVDPPFASMPPAALGRPMVVFEAVGVPGVLDDLVATVPAKARLVVAGVCMQPDTIRPLLAVVKELSLQFVFGYDQEEFDETLRDLAEGELDVEPMLTGRVGLDGVAPAFEELVRAEDQVKVLLEPGGPDRPAAW